MPHHHGQLVEIADIVGVDLAVIVAGYVQDAGIDGNIAPRQAEGIGRRRVHDIIGPVELVGDRREGGAVSQEFLLQFDSRALQPDTNLADGLRVLRFGAVTIVSVRAEDVISLLLLLVQYLDIGLLAQLDLFLDGDRVQLFAARERHFGLVRLPVEEDEEQADQDQAEPAAQQAAQPASAGLVAIGMTRQAHEQSPSNLLGKPFKPRPVARESTLAPSRRPLRTLFLKHDRPSPPAEARNPHHPCDAAAAEHVDDLVHRHDGRGVH